MKINLENVLVGVFLFCSFMFFLLTLMKQNAEIFSAIGLYSAFLLLPFLIKE